MMINTPHRIKKIFSIGLCVGALTLVACTSVSLDHASTNSTSSVSIQDSMRQMKGSLNAAAKSKTMDDFAKNIHAFDQAVAHASANTYPGTEQEKALYIQGMNELKQGVLNINTIIATGDLVKAKAALSELNAAPKKYHPILKK